MSERDDIRMERHFAWLPTRFHDSDLWGYPRYTGGWVWWAWYEETYWYSPTGLGRIRISRYADGALERWRQEAKEMLAEIAEMEARIANRAA